jgi:hypothetical protein
MLKENILQKPTLGTVFHFTSTVETHWNKILHDTVVGSLLEQNVVNYWCWCMEKKKYVNGVCV